MCPKCRICTVGPVNLGRYRANYLFSAGLSAAKIIMAHIYVHKYLLGWIMRRNNLLGCIFMPQNNIPLDNMPQYIYFRTLFAR